MVQNENKLAELHTWMVFQGRLPVGGLDLVGGCISFDAEDLVRVDCGGF